MSTYLKYALVLVASAAVLVLLLPSETGSPEEAQARRDGRTVITYWDRTQGFEHEIHKELIAEFNRSQDRIFVRALQMGWRIEKLLTAISSGAPPDLCSLESSALASLAYQGCFMDLTDWMEQYSYLQTDLFFPHTLDSVAIDGRVFAIPSMNDSYCLLWNKALFRKAGLDPERGPQTLRELEEYAVKLTSVDGSGLQTIGFLPWVPWDLTHMWGTLFGGDWYDKAVGLSTAGEDPSILASLAWQGSWQKDASDPNPPPYALDPDLIEAFFAGSMGGGAYMSANNPFYTGRIAMTVEGEWQSTFIPKYAPNLDWGIGPIPQPEGAPPRGYSPGCVAEGIPVSSRHPEEAKEFLRWFYAPRAEGASSPAGDYCYLIHNVPTRRNEATEERFMGDPKFRVFVEQLLTKEVVPQALTPATWMMVDDIARARELVLFDHVAPEDAAMQVQEKANAELKRVRRLLERTAQ